MFIYILTFIVLIIIVFGYSKWKAPAKAAVAAVTTATEKATSNNGFKIFNIDIKSLLYMVLFFGLGAGALVIVSLLAYGVFMVLEHKKMINKKWPTYKCKPYILPFAGWLVGPQGTSTTNNFVDCMFGLHKTFFGVLMEDYNVMMTAIVDIVSGHTSALQDIRGMFSYMRQSIQSHVEDVYSRIYNGFKRVEWFFGLFKKSFGQLMQVMSDVFSIMGYAYDTFGSIWNGPIGGIARFFCFAPDTKIRMLNDRLVKIGEVRVGDITASGAVITNKFIFGATGTKMYNYRGVIVSGEHIVFDDGQWRYVKDTGAPATAFDEQYIYCVNTSDGHLLIPPPRRLTVARRGSMSDIIFMDYKETGNIESKKYHEDSFYELSLKLEIVNNRLYKTRDRRYYSRNSNRSYSIIPLSGSSSAESLVQSTSSLPEDTGAPALKYYDKGLMMDTVVIMKDGTYKDIRDVRVGDALYRGTIVRGLVETSAKNIALYNYGGVQLSGYDIVLAENGEWAPIAELGVQKLPAVNELLTMRHLITDSGVVPLHGESAGDLYVRDYNIVANKKLEENLGAARMDYRNTYLDYDL